MQTSGVMPSSWLGALDLKLREWHANAVVQWVQSCGSSSIVVDDSPLTVIAPHQDDETFGCGGLIAMKRRRGADVHVIFLTDGARSHDAHEALQRDDLSVARRAEAVEATRYLGVDPAHIHFLHFPDGQLSRLGIEQSTALVDALSRLLQQQRPRQVLLPHRRDFHKDHEATFGLAIRALQQGGLNVDLLQYSIWMPWCSPLLWRLKPGYLADGVRLKLDEAAQAMRDRAIRSYRTQLAVLPPGFVKRFFSSEEVYFRHSLPRSDGPE